MKWFTTRREPQARTALVPNHLKKQDESEAVVKEVEEVLRNRRWDGKRQEPFRGFGSLPGRF